MSVQRIFQFAFFLVIATCTLTIADESESKTPATDDAASVERLYADFESMLTKSVMVGTFMIDGDDSGRRMNERYEISKVVKSSKGDYWSFFARIKYGDHDVTVPIPVEVKWAGTTPVITVDNLTIPGMGTFDSRVLISDGKYAGTWRHGKVGGLMFGHIEKQATPAVDEASDKPAEDAADKVD